jgi:probable phosphoglycerate mutase
MTWPHKKTTIIFLRHGQTDWNRQGRLQGHTETDLNTTGVEQARAIGSDARSKWVRGSPVFVSPLLRARATFDIARTVMPGVDTAIYDERLKEISYGAWEGSRWADIQSKFPSEAAQWADDPWNSNPHGGETYNDLYARVSAFLAELPATAAVIAHAGVFQVLSVALGLVSRDLAPLLSAPQGRAVVLSGGCHGQL